VQEVNPATRKRKGYTITVGCVAGECGYEAVHPEYGVLSMFGYASESKAFGAANRAIDKAVGLRLTRAFFNPKKNPLWEVRAEDRLALEGAGHRPFLSPKDFASLHGKGVYDRLKKLGLLTVKRGEVRLTESGTVQAVRSHKLRESAAYDNPKKNAKNPKSMSKAELRAALERLKDEYGGTEGVTKEWRRRISAKKNGKKATKKKAKKKAKSVGQMHNEFLIKRCRELWERYRERPSKKRLIEVLNHLDIMQGPHSPSVSKKVKSERTRCLRVAKAEAKRLKMKV